MVDSGQLRTGATQSRGNSDDIKRNRAIALVRALGTVAEGNRSYISFARNMILSQELIGLLATVTSTDGLRPLTEKGRRELKRAESTLAEALDYSKPFGEVLSDVENSCATLNALVVQSKKALECIDGKMPDVLEAEEADGFARFITMRLSVTCYFTSLRYGVGWLDSIRNLQVNSGDPERSYSVCLDALGKLRERLKTATPYGSWRVDPIVHPGCDCIAAHNGYVFRWASETDYDRAIGTGKLKEVSPGFAVGLVDGRCWYMGTGYIVGTQPINSYALKERGVHAKLPVSSFGLTRQRLDRPLDMISDYFNGDSAFCIDPQEFASALDRYVRCSEPGGR